jgi:hypothetical protein
VAIGIVPFGALVANILIDKGILAQGTPEARQGLARGQMVGGIIGILWGGKPNASTPVQAGTPVPATVGGAAAPPLVVVPSGVGVVVAAGGAVNVAAAEGEMAASLSTGGDGGSDKSESVEKPAPIRNAHLAGKSHPVTGVPFDAKGFPDFKAAGLVKLEVKITRTSSYAGDFRAANKAAGLKATPQGYTWHHHQDGVTLQLVPKDVHLLTGHTGGRALRPE